MSKCLRLLISSLLLSTSLVPMPSTVASVQETLITCTDPNSQNTIALKSNEKRCKPFHASAIWHLQQSDTSAYSGAGYANLRTCTSKRIIFNYQQIKSKCAKHQKTNDFWRITKTTSTPTIITVTARGHERAIFTLDAAKQNPDAPIAYYLVSNLKTGEINKVLPDNTGELSISSLSPLTSYTFQISAVSVDGTSNSSPVTQAITTGPAPVLVVAPVSAPVAAPAFTLSSNSETRTVNTAATGFTINSTGGLIANFAIDAIPAGMSFNTTTGALTGTPTTVAGATSYTVTATNASGSTTRVFVFTVVDVVYTVGQRGPGGGIVFYVSPNYFTSAGSTCNTMCKYLEVAPATWQSGGVTVAEDTTMQWSDNRFAPTGQDTTTVGSESLFTGEKFNWKIGQGFYNTSVMKVSGATSAAQAAVLAYAGASSAGQWFIPSMNELNELCKYARGQATGVLTTKCNNTGTLKTGTANDLGGFKNAYWSSSESVNGRLDGGVWYQDFAGGNPGYQLANTRTDGGSIYIRPIRAF
jgi:hypothetical protein